MEKPLRIVQRVGVDGSKTIVSFLDLKKDDRFTLTEPDGLPGEDGSTIYVALADADPFPQPEATNNASVLVA